MTWKDACKLLGTEPISVDGQWEAGLSSTGTSGVQFTEVDVDIETGIVKVKRILAVQDCGLIVDRLTAESQVLRRHHRLAQLRAVRGSHPRSRHRPDGQPEHGVVPAGRHVRHPEDRHHAGEPPVQRARGVIGIGEPPTVSTASSIANAVRNATGATIRSLPLTPHKILAAIEEQKAGGTL